jgi:hypothetical protein
MNRRQLLRAFGVGAAAPFVPALDGWAAGGPKRLLLMFTSSGIVPETWWPTGTETDFSFPAGSILEPLAPHKQDLIVIKNLTRKFHNLGGDHERGIGCMWTGARLNPGNQFGGGGWPSGPSIDQILARALPKQTDFASLEVGVQPFGPGAKGATRLHMNYAGSDQPVPSEPSPYKLFERLFAGAGAGTSASIEQLRAERKSVIDLVKAEIAEVQGRVGSHDRGKIEAHLEGTRAIERRLQAPAKSCAAIAPGGTIDINANDNFPMIGKLQMDLIVSAFACDRTRIAGLQWSRAFSEVRHSWAGAKAGHHGLSHDTGAKATLTALNRWYGEQFAYLLSAMKKVPEGNGTLLDNTMIVWCNELFTGWDHRPGPTPVVIAGRLGGALRAGRFIDYGANAPQNHNQLLVTIVQAMGLPSINKVGDLGTEGKLPNLLV